MSDVRRKQIGDTLIEVRKLGAKEGLRTLARLTRILGSAAERLQGGELLAAAVEAVQRLDLADVDAIVESLERCSSEVSVLQPSGKTITTALDVDRHFAGKMGPMLEWIAFAVEVNFGDFFADLRPGVAGSGASEAASKSPST